MEFISPYSYMQYIISESSLTNLSWKSESSLTKQEIEEKQYLDINGMKHKE